MKDVFRLQNVCLLVFVAVLAAHSAVFADGNTQTVRATGIAVGEGKSAQESALLDAQRKAVVEAAGVFIDAQSFVTNYELIEEHILSHARGYITDSKTIKEWTDQGLSYCEIRATVGVGNLRRDWTAALPQLIHRQSEPRCIVIFTEDADTTDSVPAKLGGSCAHRMENLLQKHGLRLIDKNTIDHVLYKDTEAAYLRGDTEQLAAKAQQFNAELLIVGEAEADPLGPHSMNGHNIYRWNMAMNARVIRADTAEIIVSDSYPRSTAYTDVSPRCGNKGFRELADKVGPKLLRDLTDKWQQRFLHRIFEMQFHGCSPDSFRQQLLPALSRMPGVRAYDGITVRNTAAEESMAEIYWAGNLHSLISAVKSVKIDGVELSEGSSSGMRVRFEVNGLN